MLPAVSNVAAQELPPEAAESQLGAANLRVNAFQLTFAVGVGDTNVPTYTIVELAIKRCCDTIGVVFSLGLSPKPVPRKPVTPAIRP